MPPSTLYTSTYIHTYYYILTKSLHGLGLGRALGRCAPGPGPSPHKDLVTIYAYVCIYVDVYIIFVGSTAISAQYTIRVIRNT
jgi:hypothetical protein